MKRQSPRIKAKGIVVLGGVSTPVVMNICDIALGGVSFLFGEEIDILTTEFKMDLLIYDSQTDFDYFITRIKGKVTSKTLLDDAAFNSQVWRYGVKFLDMDNTKENLLQTYFRLRGKIRS